MSNRVACQNCGGRVDVPAGYTRAKIRCPGCGYYAEVPAEMRAGATAVDDRPTGKATPARAARPEPAPPAPTRAADDDVEDANPYGFSGTANPPPPGGAVPARPPKPRKARPQANPRDTRPQFEGEEGAGPPLLSGNRDEHDDETHPYAVPGTGLVRCPHCRGELPAGAGFCVHCGKDVTRGTKAERSFQPINREWDEGWPLQLRLQITAGAMVLNVLAAGTLVAAKEMDLVSAFFGMIPQVALQVFLLGSFDSLLVKRTSKGQTTLTRTRRVCFYNIQPTKLKWKQSEAVGIIGTHNPGLFAWLTCIYLALFCIVPALVFYWYVIRPERFDVALCDVYGSTDEVVYHSQNRDQAHEVASVLSEATGLMYKPVM